MSKYEWIFFFPNFGQNIRKSNFCSEQRWHCYFKFNQGHLLLYVEAALGPRLKRLQLRVNGSFQGYQNFVFYHFPPSPLKQNQTYPPQPNGIHTLYEPKILADLLGFGRCTHNINFWFKGCTSSTHNNFVEYKYSKLVSHNFCRNITHILTSLSLFFTLQICMLMCIFL